MASSQLLAEFIAGRTSTRAMIGHRRTYLHTTGVQIKLPQTRVPRCGFWAFAVASHNCEHFLNAHSPLGWGVMLRTEARLKVKPAPTRRGARALWTGGRYFKRHVRLVSRPAREQAPDLLRQLEREVGPLADALTRAEPRIVLPRAKPRIVLTRTTPRIVLLRALLRTAIAGMAMAALVIAWQHIPNDARNTDTTGGRISEAKEVAGPRATIVEPEAGYGQLEVWHEDSNLLLYRSPWRPR